MSPATEVQEFSIEVSDAKGILEGIDGLYSEGLLNAILCKLGRNLRKHFHLEDMIQHVYSRCSLDPKNSNLENACCNCGSAQSK